MSKGKLIKARLFFDKAEDKSIGFATSEGIQQPIKVWGLKNLNRSLHMDEVLLRFVQWTDWGKASSKQTDTLDFEEHLQFIEEPEALIEELTEVEPDLERDESTEPVEEVEAVEEEVEYEYYDE